MKQGLKTKLLVLNPHHFNSSSVAIWWLTKEEWISSPFLLLFRISTLWLGSLCRVLPFWWVWQPSYLHCWYLDWFCMWEICFLRLFSTTIFPGLCRGTFGCFMSLSVRKGAFAPSPMGTLWRQSVRFSAAVMRSISICERRKLLIRPVTKSDADLGLEISVLPPPQMCI